MVTAEGRSGDGEGVHWGRSPQLSATIEVTDVHLVALRMLVDRRDELSKARMQAANRLHGRLSELVPGQAKRDVTTGQAQTPSAHRVLRSSGGEARSRRVR